MITNKKLKEIGYSINKEYSGNKGKYFVLRFRGEFIGAFETPFEANVEAFRGHEKRKVS